MAEYESELPEFTCKHGKLHERALWLRVHVGEATGPDGTKYEMAMVNGSSPVILESGTSRSWTISWPELLAMAIAAGLGKKASDT